MLYATLWLLGANVSTQAHVSMPEGFSEVNKLWVQKKVKVSFKYNVDSYQ